MSEEQPPRPTSRAGRIIIVVAVLTMLALVVIAVGAVVVGQGFLKRSTTTPGPLTNSATVTANRGKVVFSDDFHDPSSGWTTETLPSGTTLGYTATSYVIVAKGTLAHFAASPYLTAVQQVAMVVTATQSNGAPIGAGYGVSCWRGTNAAELRYDFVVTSAGDWQVDRRNGGISSQALILKTGRSSAVLGSAPVAVQGMCATQRDLQTTRLVLFAGKQKVADFTNAATAMPDAGWLADLLVISEAIKVSVVTATHYEVRDLSR